MNIDQENKKQRLERNRYASHSRSYVVGERLEESPNVKDEQDHLAQSVINLRPQKLIFDPVQQLPSPSNNDLQYQKVISFYESVVSKMSEEMQKLLYNKNQQDESLQQVIDENSNLQSILTKLTSKNQTLESALSSKETDVVSLRKIVEKLETKVSDQEHELNNQISI